MAVPTARWCLRVSTSRTDTMNLTFDLPAVRRWAEFSGDFNPIHFDLAHARKAGMDKLIVHGMLALMPIKQMLSQRSVMGAVNDAVNDVVGDVVSDTVSDTASAHPSWIKFKAAFRHPLAHDSDHVLITHASGKKISFQLTSHNGGSSHIESESHTSRIENFRGVFNLADALPDDIPPTPPTAHCFDIAAQQLVSFVQTYPEITSTWVALDAVVFAQFMRHGLPIVEQRVHNALPTASGGSITFNQDAEQVNNIVVQTSHAVYVDATLNNAAGHLQWALLAPVLLVQGSQVSGAVSLPIYRDNRLVMLVEIGLLAKVSRVDHLNESPS